MVIPEWKEFLAFLSVSGGAIALVLLDLLIHFTPDSIDAEIEKAKPYLAMLFSFIVPQIVATIGEMYPVVDPGWWAVIYALGSYAVHEILYRIIQKPDLVGRAIARVKALFA
jgi:hypothetical protein